MLQTMTAPTTLHVVEGGDHSFAAKGVSKVAMLDGLVDVVAGWVASAVGRRGVALAAGRPRSARRAPCAYSGSLEWRCTGSRLRADRAG